MYQFSNETLLMFHNPSNIIETASIYSNLFKTNVISELRSPLDV